jgi:serine protease Do
MTARVKILWLGGLLLLGSGAFGTWMLSSGSHSVVYAASIGPSHSLGVSHSLGPNHNLSPGQVPLQTGFEPAVKKILPAVVNVSCTKVLKSPGLSDPKLRQFFEENFGRLPHQMRENSLGSGVVVTRDGYILTNSHVVEEADSIHVSLPDGREFDAKVIGNDKQSDLAVLKIDAQNLPVADWGAPDRVAVGDFALAVGNPFGVGETVTMGIVSAMGRGGLGIEDIENFIQTDASINPGNSGGPLVNANGNVIGINTAIITGGSGGSQGIGFAIPAAMARSVMDQIVKSGKVTRGWLGVTAQPLSPEIAKSFGLPQDSKGALIGDVAPNGPAAKAGLHTGDVILSLNGAGVVDPRQLGLKISQIAPGTAVKLRISRDGKEMEVTATLGEMPGDEPKQVSSAPAEANDAKPELGANLAPLTPDLRENLKIAPDQPGLLVAEVEPGSPAAQAGLEHGDVIQELNRKPVSTVDAFQSAMDKAGPDPQLLTIDRAGSHSFVSVSMK